MSMRKPSARVILKLSLATACFLLLTSFPSDWLATPQDSQGPSSGPNAPVGETVIVPKKKTPTPTAPPAEAEPAPGGQPAPAAPAGPPKPEKINPNEVFTLSTSTNLVNVDVLVLDKSGNPITTLGKKNFRILDDGVPQSVSNFGTAEAPMTICMLIEFSNKWWPFLYLALEDAYSFLDFIQPKDWVAVVPFDMKPTILQDFTQDRSQVRAALDQLRIPGFSEINLYDALAFIIDRMKDIQGRKAILAIVTGYDTFSKLTYDQILKIVRTSDTPIYPVSILEFMAVRYGDNIDTLQARNALQTFANYSGGQAFFPRFEGELPGIYQQVAGQLRTQYSVGFVPTNAARDGKFHKLKVELVDDQGNPLRIVDQKGKQVKYRVVARDGYYAPKS